MKTHLTDSKLSSEAALTDTDGLFTIPAFKQG